MGTSALGIEAYFTAWGQMHATPVMLLALDGDILWANAAAMDLVNDGADFVVEDGRLCCAETVQTTQLRHLLSTLRDTPKTWIYTRADGGHFVARVDPIKPEGGPPAAGFTLFSTGPERPCIWADFEPLFHLTRAEGDIARRVVDGASAQEIAQTLGLSIETVRTHIRRLYAKLGASGRERLFAILSPFRIV